MVSSALSSRCAAVVVAWILVASPAFAQPRDPGKLLEEADRLAWMKSWSRAEPLFADAEKLFAAQGDTLNTLHAQVGHLRSQLTRLPVPDVSRRLGEYLDDPAVQGDDRLRLRVLVAKGETDEDLDPVSARQSWQDALKLAEKLGEAATANRARGELGVVAALLGEVSASVIQLGMALKVAQANNDTPSVVRWLTLFGRGFAEMDRAGRRRRLLRPCAGGCGHRARIDLPGDDLPRKGRGAGQARTTPRSGVHAQQGVGERRAARLVGLPGGAVAQVGVPGGATAGARGGCAPADQCAGLRPARGGQPHPRAGGARRRSHSACAEPARRGIRPAGERHRCRSDDAGADGATETPRGTRRGARVRAPLRGRGGPAGGGQRPARRASQQGEQSVGSGTDHQRRARHPARPDQARGHARARCGSDVRHHRAGPWTRLARTASGATGGCGRPAGRVAGARARGREAAAAVVPADESCGPATPAGSDSRGRGSPRADGHRGLRPDAPLGGHGRDDAGGLSASAQAERAVPRVRLGRPAVVRRDCQQAVSARADARRASSVAASDRGTPRRHSRRPRLGDGSRQARVGALERREGTLGPRRAHRQPGRASCTRSRSNCWMRDPARLSCTRTRCPTCRRRRCCPWSGRAAASPPNGRHSP